MKTKPKTITQINRRIELDMPVHLTESELSTIGFEAVAGAPSYWTCNGLFYHYAKDNRLSFIAGNEEAFRDYLTIGQ